MHRQFETAEPIEIRIDLGDGRLVVRAEDTTRTEITITGARSDRFEITSDGQRISVAAPTSGMWRFGRHDVQVTIPTGSDVITRCGSATANLLGRFGDVQAHTDSGDLDCASAESLSASGGSAEISIGEVGVLRVKSGSGRVRADIVRERAEVTTGSGEIVAGAVVGSLTAKSGSGNLRIGQLAGDARFTTSSGSTTIDQATGGRIDLTSASGGSRIGVPKGTPVWTDITSVAGRITSHLPPTGEPTAGQAYVEIRIHCVSGNVRLEPVRQGPQDSPVPAYPQDRPPGPDRASASAEIPNHTAIEAYAVEPEPR